MTKIINEANKKQNNPATATVVNFGVSFLHLKVTEKTEKPIADIIPKINPLIDPIEEDKLLISNLIQILLAYTVLIAPLFF